MKKVFCVVEIWVELILASQGGHKTRPYEKRGSVGATLLVALARTSHGTDSK